MTTINDVCINALLADSSYVNDLVVGMTGVRLTDALADRMTPTLAKYIADNFTVVTQASGYSSSFDATVWIGNEGTAYAGQVYVSMRGTQEGTDFVQDADLAVTGLAHAQLADMVNWWLRETTPADRMAKQVAVETISVAGVPVQNFVGAADIQGTGGLLGIGEVKSINGHSLGGYLATAFARLFGKQQTPMEINTFNSAGYLRLASLNIENGFNQIALLVGPSLGLGDFSGAQNNYFAENGINVTTNTWNPLGFRQYGTRIGLYQEDSGLPGVSNHSMYKLTDLLALGNMLEKLDPSFDLAKLSLLVQEGSGQMASSYEAVLDDVRRLLLGGDIIATPAGDTDGSSAGMQSASRIAFQQNIADLQNSAPYSALCGQVKIEALAGKSAETLANLARNGDSDARAYAYALQELNPFAVLGIDYGAHNADGALDPYDETSGEGQLTEHYLADRAKMLCAFIEANARDSEQFAGIDIGDFDSKGWRFIDTNLGRSIGVAGLQDVDHTPSPHLIAFGGAGADSLVGGEENDALYGGSGDDTLEGGAGADYLEGGAGSDCYVAGNGDVIFDRDGVGQLAIDGVVVHGGRAVVGNRWQDSDGNSYQLVDDDDGQRSLSVGVGSASVLIRDYRDGALGIRLQGEEAPAAFVQSGNGITVIGDRMAYQMPWNLWLIQLYPTWPYLFDANGNMVRTSVPAPYYADKVFDTVADDVIDAGDGLNVIFAYSGGNNRIVTGANDDYILGGAGRDLVFSGGMVDTVAVGAGDDIVYGEGGRDVIDGGAGDDFLAGGDGGDAIFGGAGNDRIFAGESMTWARALHDTGVASSSPQDSGELLIGGSGDDLVIGGATADALLGGEGQDALAGREGDDLLFGDASADFVAPSLTEFDPIISAQHWPMGPVLGYHSPFSSAPMLQIVFERGADGAVTLTSRANPEAPRENWLTAAVAGGDDQLSGGSGNDWLFGEFGSDLLDGGRGDDLLVGGVGDDTYVFRRGDGQDVVVDDDAAPGNRDAALFADLDLADLRLTRQAENLIVAARAGSDRVTLTNWFADARFRIERMIFADGTALDVAGILAALENRAPAGEVVLGGVASQYQRLSASNTLTDADGLGDIRYRWEVANGSGWSAIGGAEGNSFTLTQAEVGRTIRAVAYYTDGIGRDESVASAASGIVGNVNDAPVGEVFVSGSAVQDAVLVAGETLADIDGLGPVAYRWQRSDDGAAWSDIDGASAPSLRLTQAEVGRQVRVLASYTDGYGTFETVASAASAIVKALYRGASGNDVLAGSAAGDVLVGGDGNDTYVVNHPDDLVVETAGGGIDVVRASVDTRLPENVENLTLIGDAALDGSGNDAANVIVGNAAANTLSGLAGDDTLLGGAADDRLLGGADDDRLSGAGGNDTLDGGNGADLLQGGAGDDSYVADAGDKVVEADHAGTDTVFAAIDWTLGDNLEKLVLTGTAALSGTGNALDNVLLGNRADNLLDGGKGADTMAGGAGDDRYVVDARDDVVVELADDGLDQILSSQSFALPENVEVLVLTGKAGLRGTGNALDNLLCGNAGNNALDGGDGRDILQGAGGNDTLSDRSGTTAFIGGAGKDKLIGGDSAGLFIGGAGDDSLVAGAGDDVVCFNAGDGRDTVAGGGSGRDTLSLGGGIARGDLAFRRAGKDLVLEIGSDDRISLSDWYAAKPSRAFVNLQLLVDAMASFDVAGNAPSSAQAVEVFDFAALASDFDAARALDPHLKSWSLDNALAAHRVGGPETAAFGGDLAYQYASRGSLAGVGLAAAQQVIGEAGFGSRMQALHPFAELQGGAVRLL